MIRRTGEKPTASQGGIVGAGDARIPERGYRSVLSSGAPKCGYSKQKEHWLNPLTDLRNSLLRLKPTAFVRSDSPRSVSRQCSFC